MRPFVLISDGPLAQEIVRLLLLGESERLPRKRGPTPKWQKHIEAIAQLSRTQQQFIAQMLEVALAQVQQREKDVTR